MISVYDIGNENFDKNGDAVLTPTSAVVKQVAGGNYDISIEHPIDAEGKWAHLVPGAIVKAPVPREVIENSFSGVEADVYKVTTPAQLREDTIAPHAITYDSWSRSPSEVYEKGDKVSFDGENYEVQYYDGKSGETQIDPDKITWYKKIAKMTDGAPVLVSLNTGDELYYIEDANENWYKMSTFYGVVGYIPKAQVTYDRHVTPSESQPRIITDQLFRLQDPVIDNEKMTVKVTGQHVSYDLKGDLLKPISIYSAGPAMMMGIITGSLMYTYRGTVATNMSSADHGTYTGEIKGKNGMFALLDPDKGLVSHFDAKFTRDNWDLFVLEKEDTDRGYKIRYGVNARGISWKKNSANLVTRVVPVAKDEKGEDLYLPEVWIDSEDINDYPVIMMEQIKVEGQVGKAKDASGDATWTEEDLLDEMREKAEERFSIDHADQIYQEVTIQIELVEDTDEYAWLKGLKDLLLYDIVTAVDERTGLDKKLYVSELEYDSIRERITGIKLTNIQDYDVRTVTGYNVKNNSIGLEKLTDEVTRGLVNQAVNIMPQYADPNAKRTADNLNTKTADGIVLKGQGNANKVWGTDSQGNPGWVSAGGFDPNNLSESSTDPTDNDYTMQIGSTSYKLKFSRVWNYIKGKILGYTQSGKNYPVQADSNGKMYVNVPWTDTTYSGGSGIRISGSNEIIMDVHRVYESANNRPTVTSARIREYGPGANYNLPTNDWYHIIEATGVDGSYTTQLALGMTTVSVYYRNYKASQWSDWVQVTTPIASDTVRGGFRTGYTKSGRNYPVEIDGYEKAYVNVPWVEYSAGSGLRLSGSDEFIIDVKRVSESANHLPNLNSFMLREYAAGSNYNLPSNHYYHIYEAKGSDADYGTQLALGMTTTAAYYRNYNGGTWGAWQSLIDTTYTLPLAASGTRGGIKIGYTKSGKKYPVELSSEKAYVEVPWDEYLVETVRTGASSNISSSSKSSISKDVTKSGYTAIGLVGWSGSGTSNFAFADVFVSGNTFYAYFWNLSSASQKINYIDAQILYKKN